MKTGKPHNSVLFYTRWTMTQSLLFIVLSIIITMVVHAATECNKQRAVDYKNEPECTANNAGTACTVYRYTDLAGNAFTAECAPQYSNLGYNTHCRDAGGWTFDTNDIRA